MLVYINSDERTGRVEHIIKYFKKEIIGQINKIDIRDENLECEGIEVIQDNIDNILELINGIYQDYITGEVGYDTPIKVYRNSMGAYQYEKLKEDKGVYELWK